MALAFVLLLAVFYASGHANVVNSSRAGDPGSGDPWAAIERAEHRSTAAPGFADPVCVGL
jgi:hypothetical protein